jgi:charged multivesicular body protein 7
MLKRKLSHDLSLGPHASVFGDDPTRGRHRKRLFRNNNGHLWTPKAERDMSDLLDFVLQHEEAFKK